MTLEFTRRIELFVSTLNVDSCLPSFCVLRATGQEAACDELVHSLFIPSKITRMCCRMDGRMSLVVIFAFPWRREASLA
jgi:hypothetical protein